MGRHSRLISLFFLAVLVLIKVSALHVYTHQETHAAYDTCAWCHLALETQQGEYLDVEKVSMPEAASEAVAYSPPVAPRPAAALQGCQNGYYCRPPPAIL